MNILLTGGAGYIGTHTAIALAEAGHNIVIYDNLCNSSRTAVDSLKKILNKELIFVQGDVRDTQLLEKTLQKNQVDVVTHFAGLKAVGDSVFMPLEYYENNIQGTLSLVRAMDSQGIKKLVFSSSATVYGKPQYLPIDEVHPLAPTNPYGRTKLHIEQMLEDFSRANLRWKILNLRYFNPVGAHPSGLLGEEPQGIPNNLMPYIARVATGEIAMLKVFGNNYPTVDGTGVRDYIHVMDLAAGHVAAVSYMSKEVGFETFNLGAGVGYSVLQMIDAYEQACGKKIPYEIVDNRSGDVSSCYAAPSKANQVLKWRAVRTLLDMCSSSWDFECQRHKN